MTDRSSKTTYDTKLLIEQTRLVAAEYRNNTGQALPVTAELARFDAIDKLNLQKLDGEEGIDAIDANTTQEKYLIKGRVIFKSGKARQKLGQLSLGSGWEYLLMVLYDGDYHPIEIYKVDRKVIEKELVCSNAKQMSKDKPKPVSKVKQFSKDKRGSMTIAKYKAIGELVWVLDS